MDPGGRRRLALGGRPQDLGVLPRHPQVPARHDHDSRGEDIVDERGARADVVGEGREVAQHQPGHEQRDDGAADDGFRLAPGLKLGDEVTAGQIIGYMGDSGNAENSVAHLHFEIRDPWGRAVPSFWSLRAAEARQACTIGIGPWSTPTLRPQPDAVTDTDLITQLGGNTPDTFDSAAAERERTVWHTVVTPLYGEGQWVIDSDGRVIATGDAARIDQRPEVIEERLRLGDFEGDTSRANLGMNGERLLTPSSIPKEL